MITIFKVIKHLKPRKVNILKGMVSFPRPIKIYRLIKIIAVFSIRNYIEEIQEVSCLNKLSLSPLCL